jgi:hypothetical protein
VETRRDLENLGGKPDKDHRVYADDPNAAGDIRADGEAGGQDM